MLSLWLLKILFNSTTIHVFLSHNHFQEDVLFKVAFHHSMQHFHYISCIDDWLVILYQTFSKMYLLWQYVNCMYYFMRIYINCILTYRACLIFHSQKLFGYAICFGKFPKNISTFCCHGRFMQFKICTFINVFVFFLLFYWAK